jgi:hypothetical protein
MSGTGRRLHVRLERGILPVVVHVSEEHESWYTDERHSSLVSLLPEILGDLLQEREADKKKGDAVRVKEDVFRGAHMELRCFFRNTQPLYHVLVPGGAGPPGTFASLRSADTSSPHTLHVTASPHN